MSITAAFNRLRQVNQPALILYYPAGYPDMEQSFRNIQLLAENGADIIEIGIPFSDPLADGPLIQEASCTALEQGAGVHTIMAGIERLSVSVPLVIMSYLNPLAACGCAEFCTLASAAGISGVIIPDLPADLCGTWKQPLSAHDIELILLAAPNSSRTRLELISGLSAGFIYAVSRLGTTGISASFSTSSDFLDILRSLSDTPVALGFGISNTAQIRAAGRIADGVIIGSRLIQAVKRGEDLAALTRSFKRAASESRKEAQ